MAEAAKAFPIPCRNCGKMALVSITPGSHSLHCAACEAQTVISARTTDSGWEIRTALAASKPSSGPTRLGGK
jgi:LSD1 subclass zinc finger protein